MYQLIKQLELVSYGSAKERELLLRIIKELTQRISALEEKLDLIVLDYQSKQLE